LPKYLKVDKFLLFYAFFVKYPAFLRVCYCGTWTVFQYILPKIYSIRNVKESVK